MLFGTFDTVHEGHRDLFRQAKQHAERLIVSVARTENILRLKGRLPVHSEKERLAVVRQEPLVDKSFLGQIRDPFQVIKREKPDMIALGYDQTHALAQFLPDKLKNMGLNRIRIVRLEPFKPAIYKSSKILKRS